MSKFEQLINLLDSLRVTDIFMKLVRLAGRSVQPVRLCRRSVDPKPGRGDTVSEMRTHIITIHVVSWIERASADKLYRANELQPHVLRRISVVHEATGSSY